MPMCSLRPKKPLRVSKFLFFQLMLMNPRKQNIQASKFVAWTSEMYCMAASDLPLATVTGNYDIALFDLWAHFTRPCARNRT